MTPSKTVQKAVTPDSVKGLMLVEAGIIGFLGYWIANEYVYNAYFRTYLDQVVLSHITTYTAALGLGIGLAGSAVAAALYRNLRHARSMLENLGASKFRGAMSQVLAGLPALDEGSPSPFVREEFIHEAIETPVPATSRMSALVARFRPGKSKKNSD
jgi:hypothetical protein